MSALYRLGFLVREAGVALDKLGCMLQGNFAFREQLNRSRNLMNLGSRQPVLGNDVFVAPNAVVVGDVQLGNQSSVYMGAVLRGDSGKISVGEQTNIQDGTVISTGANSIDGHAADTKIGSKVTIGHQVSLHGCTIEDEALIGMGATINGAKIERGSMVAAGAVVAHGTVVPASEIWGGNPARHLRSLKAEEAKFLSESAAHYVNVSAEHLKNANLSLIDIANQKGLA